MRFIGIICLIAGIGLISAQLYFFSMPDNELEWWKLLIVFVFTSGCLLGGALARYLGKVVLALNFLVLIGCIGFFIFSGSALIDLGEYLILSVYAALSLLGAWISLGIPARPQAREK